MTELRPFRFGVQASSATNRSAWVEMARRVEAHGYSCLTLPDHFSDQFAPVPAMMSAADATTSLRVGTLVLDNDYKHPVVLAKEMATVDLLSDGRLELGIGAGWMRTDYDAAGLPYDSAGVRIDRFVEALGVLKGLFTDGPLTFKPNVLVATGRCSYEGSPVHQMPRSGRERECIRARGAWCGYPAEMVLGSTDYEAGELVTLAQFNYWLFGHSRMRDVINQTGSPSILHSDLAAEVLGVSLEEFLVRLKAKDKTCVDFRQAMKPIGFGRGGGMGTPKMVLTSRKKNAGFTKCPGGPARDPHGNEGYWGIRFCILVGGAKVCGSDKLTTWGKKNYPCAPVCRQCCEVVENLLNPAYDRRYPEMKEYFKWGGKKVENHEPAPSAVWDAASQSVRLTRLRGGCEYSAFLNNGFQSMLGDIMKAAYVDATRECYLGVKPDGSPSPLAGCRLPLAVHDEPVSELFLDTAHLSGPRIAEIMVVAGYRFAPDVTWKAETALAFFLSKKMEPVYVNGKLVPWVPEEKRAA